jgi:hypothetical protein
MYRLSAKVPPDFHNGSLVGVSTSWTSSYAMISRLESTDSSCTKCRDGTSDDESAVATRNAPAKLVIRRSLQLAVFSLSLFEDGDIGVSVFPECEKILIRGAGFGGVALHYVGAGEAEMRKCSNGFVQHN